MMESILFEQTAGVAFITMNRPDKFNAFNRPMALRLQEVLDACAADDNIRAVYLTGNGKAFCAGQDLQEVLDPEGPGMNRILS
ncbi:MAG TPA: 2-(1,2-epoxy-1,2-dihydrophenyl)acetyl-CoA isomerase, partial [Chitinophagaceae bacterium]|nr:2-(1,2-epoxy-1,2-dihydrophenyl)acetyl-CoA isomerase [Chitinophagaceae bacterium]